jgi:hypothetical protein
MILSTLMVAAIFSSETSVLITVTGLHIHILHSHRRENHKFYITLTGWILSRRCNVTPVRYELGFYIPEDDILHSHRRAELKFYKMLVLSFIVHYSNIKII